MCQQAKAERIWQGDVQGQQLEGGGILILHAPCRCLLLRMRDGRSFPPSSALHLGEDMSLTYKQRHVQEHGRC